MNELTRKEFLKKAVGVGGAALSSMTIYQCVTTATGKKAFIVVSESEEQKLGAEAYQEIMKKERKSSNGHRTSILKRVGRNVAKVSHRPDYKWEFNLLDSKTVNAYCLPGGKIAFFDGIMPYCKDEAGIAVVMGHEIGHATARHGAQRISQGMVAQVGLGVAGLSLKNSKYRNIILAGLGAGAMVGVMLPYSREHEYEADRLGMTYLSKAGYDPEIAVQFWERFQKLTAGKEGSDFLSTHPLTSKRLAKMKEFMPEAKRLYNAAPVKYGAGETV